jgi:hypothetical protein
MDQHIWFHFAETTKVRAIVTGHQKLVVSESNGFPGGLNVQIEGDDHFLILRMRPSFCLEIAYIFAGIINEPPKNY